jgi:hypothetical protein
METPDAIYSLLLDMLEACYDTYSRTSEVIRDTSGGHTANKKKKTKNDPQLHNKDLAFADSMQPGLDWLRMSVMSFVA